MNKLLSNFINGLSCPELNCSVEEISDILWLAQYVCESAPISEVQIDNSNRRNPLQLPHLEPTEPKPISTPPELAINAEEYQPQLQSNQKINLHLPGLERETNNLASGTEFRAPAPTALPEALKLSRAFRPLKRKIRSRTRFEIDEVQTINQVTEEEIWEPIFQQTFDRFSSLTLIVDAGFSMNIWYSTIREFCNLVTSLGVFHRISLWSWATDDENASNHQITPPLFPQLVQSNHPKSSHDYREIVQSEQNQIILILSDCISKGWHSGALTEALSFWQCSAHVAILHLLPEYLWTHTALLKAIQVQVSAYRPMPYNYQLQAEPISEFLKLSRKHNIRYRNKPRSNSKSPLFPIPVFPLEHKSILDWSNLLTGNVSNDMWVTGFEFPSNPLEDDLLPPLPEDPEKLIDRYWEMASPEAQQLALYMSACPVISLPVIRLVRHTMLGKAGKQIHEAEFLLGGLLKPIEKNLNTHPEDVQYGYKDGVRASLLSSLPSDETIKVLYLIADYIESHLGSVRNFRAMLASPSKAEGSFVVSKDPVCQITSEILSRLGGNYANLVQQDLSSEDPKYQTLIDTLKKEAEKGLILVQSSSVKADQLITNIRRDIPQKKCEVIENANGIESFTQQVESLSNQVDLNLLFVKGLEYWIYEYIKPANRNQEDQTEPNSLRQILSDINFIFSSPSSQFNFRFVYFLPRFAINLITSKLPNSSNSISDFFEFQTDSELLNDEIKRVLETPVYSQYSNLSAQERKRKLIEIQSYLDEKLLSTINKSELLFSQGVLFAIDKMFPEALERFDQALVLNPNLIIALFWQGNALLELGELEKAIESFDRFLEFDSKSYKIWHNRGIALARLGHSVEAVANFDQSIQIKDDEGPTWSMRGVALVELGKLEEAVISFRNGLSLNPNDYKIWGELAKALHNLYRFDEAIECYDKALNGRPNDYQAWINRGTALAMLGQFDKAVASFDKGLPHIPEDHNGWNNRGAALANLGRYDEAKESFQEVLKIRPDDVTALDNLGSILTRQGRNKEALLYFEKAAEIEPNYFLAWHNKAITLSSLGKFNQAIECFDKALKIKPDNSESWYSLGNVQLNLNQLNEALFSYTKALSYNPNHSDALNNRGFIFIKLKNINNASKDFDEALKIKPDNFNALKNKANLLLFAFSNFQEAVANFDKALKTQNDDFECWNNRSICLFKLKRYQEAIAGLDKALEIDPDYFYAWANKAELLVVSNQFDKAILCFENALRIHPDNPIIWGKKGLILFLLGHYLEALESFEEAIKINPDSAELWNNHGAVLLLLSRNEEAEESFERALTINPHFKIAKHHRKTASDSIHTYFPNWVPLHSPSTPMVTLAS